MHSHEDIVIFKISHDTTEQHNHAAAAFLFDSYNNRISVLVNDISYTSSFNISSHFQLCVHLHAR